MALVFLPAGYTYLFKGGPWEGTIKDIETGEPLEGTVVLAVWEMDYMSPGGSVSQFYKASEVVTNKEGVFKINPYTPIALLPIFQMPKGPYFTIYKPGYMALDRTSGDFLLKNARGKNKTIKDNWFGYYSLKLMDNEVHLPKAKNKKDRIRILGIIFDDVPDSDMKNLLRAREIERKNLNLD